MLTAVRVCAWCNRELLEGDKPGKKYAPGCTPANASHSCCTECRRGVDTEIKTLLRELEHEKLQKVQLSTD